MATLCESPLPPLWLSGWQKEKQWPLLTVSAPFPSGIKPFYNPFALLPVILTIPPLLFRSLHSCLGNAFPNIQTHAWTRSHTPESAVHFRWLSFHSIVHSLPSDTKLDSFPLFIKPSGLDHSAVLAHPREYSRRHKCSTSTRLSWYRCSLCTPGKQIVVPPT